MRIFTSTTKRYITHITWVLRLSLNVVVDEGVVIKGDKFDAGVTGRDVHFQVKFGIRFFKAGLSGVALGSEFRRWLLSPSNAEVLFLKLKPRKNPPAEEFPFKTLGDSSKPLPLRMPEVLEVLGGIWRIKSERWLIDPEFAFVFLDSLPRQSACVKKKLLPNKILTSHDKIWRNFRKVSINYMLDMVVMPQDMIDAWVHTKMAIISTIRARLFIQIWTMINMCNWKTWDLPRHSRRQI